MPPITAANLQMKSWNLLYWMQVSIVSAIICLAQIPALNTNAGHWYAGAPVLCCLCWMSSRKYYCKWWSSLYPHRYVLLVSKWEGRAPVDSHSFVRHPEQSACLQTYHCNVAFSQLSHFKIKKKKEYWMSLANGEVLYWVDKVWIHFQGKRMKIISI